MGRRGVLPSIEFELGEELQDTSPPAWLASEAQAFWARHCDVLVTNKLLNQRTADNYALLCQMWGDIRAYTADRTSTRYRNLVKEFNTLSKIYRLLPTEKGGRTPDERFNKGEFEF